MNELVQVGNDNVNSIFARTIDKLLNTALSTSILSKQIIYFYIIKTNYLLLYYQNKRRMFTSYEDLSTKNEQTLMIMEQDSFIIDQDGDESELVQSYKNKTYYGEQQKV